MLQSELARASGVFGGAVHDIVESPVGCDRAGELPRQARALGGRAAFDRDQHGAGGHACAQLLDEEPLEAAARDGEEGSQIAGDDHVARDPPGARRDDREPGEQRRAPIGNH